MGFHGELFRGNGKDCQQFLKNNSDYYVYLLLRPDGRPFYVGKGKDYRVMQHENEATHPNGRRSNAHKLNVIRSIWRSDSAVIYAIDSMHSIEGNAYSREAELIFNYGRLHENGPLTNLDPGGGSTAGSSPISKTKHSNTLGGIPENDIETATLNEFVLDIGAMRSVVLKPRSRFEVKPTQEFQNNSRSPTKRQAVALAASASANGIIVEGGCDIPRTVEIDGIKGFVENGVSRDIVTSKMATIIPNTSPEGEKFRLTERQAKVIVELVGVNKCIDLGIVSASYSEAFQ